MKPISELSGELIGGRYLLEKRIGEGGMGTVYSGVDKTLARQVAVKVLFSGDERDRDGRVERFLREARLAAAVQHPNVVHIVDFGSTEDGRPFMVMEHLAGETLADRLATRPPPKLGEILEVVEATLGGLAAAHDKGIVHRDMKPENIFLTATGDGVLAKILDFGISRSLVPESGHSSALTTREGFLVGTPQYMSPEQARGHADIDRRTDLYSVGVVLYEAVTGRLPYDSNHVGDLIILIADGGAPSLSLAREEVGGTLSAFVEQAMARDRADRFEDARAMRDALRELRKELSDDIHSLATRPRKPRSAPPAALSEPEASEQRASEPGASSDEPSGTAATAVSPSAKGPKKGKAKKAQTVKGKPSGSEASDEGYLATLPAAPTPSPSTKSIETPRAWTVGEERPRASRRSPLPFVLAAIAIAGGGAAAWYSSNDPPAQTAGSVEEPGVEEPGVEDPGVEGPGVEGPGVGEVVVPEPPVSPEAETARVVFAGVPEGALVHVDGEPIEGTEARLEPGREYRFEVEAEGMRTFEHEELVSGDVTVEVSLVRERRRDRPGRMTTRPDPGAPLRDLDY